MKNLPLLKYNIEENLFENKTSCPVPEPLYISQGEKTKGRKITFSEGMKGVKREDRAKERARFWPGIARAMAEQWGSVT